jgi:MFS family permease
MALGGVICALGNLWCAFASSFPEFVLARFLAGLGAGWVQVVGNIVLADISTPAQRGRMMSIYQGTFLFSVGVGPFPGGLLAEHFGDGGEDARIRDARPASVEALEALQADATPEFREPVDGFVHQSGIAAAVAGGGEQQGLRVDDPVVARTRVSRNTDGGPLVPEQIDHPRGEVVKRILE